MTAGFTYTTLFTLLLAFYAIGLLLERLITCGKISGYSPMIWFASLWLVSLFLLSLNMYEFVLVLSSETFSFILGIHAAFIIGCLFGISLPAPPRGERKIQTLFSPGMLTGFLCLGILGVSIYALDTLLASSLSLSQRLSLGGMGAIKEEYSSALRVGRFGSKVMLLAYYFYGMGQVGMIVHRFQSAQGTVSGHKTRNLVYLFISLIAFNSIFITGGRIELVINIIMYLMSGALPDKKPVIISFKKLFRGTAVVALTIVIFAVGIAMLDSRVGGGTNSVQMLYLVHAASISTEFSALVRNSSVLSTIALQMSYLTAPIPFMGAFVDYYSRSGSQIYFGALDFYPAISVINKFLPLYSENTLVEAAQSRTIILESTGFFGNVWATMARELLIDFGIGGTTAFFFFFGLMANSVRNRLCLNPSPELSVLYVLIRLQLFWSIAHGLFHHRTFGYAFTISVFLVLLTVAFNLMRNRDRGSI